MRRQNLKTLMCGLERTLTKIGRKNIYNNSNDRFD